MNDALDRIIAEIKAELPRSLSLHPPEEWAGYLETEMFMQVRKELREMWMALLEDDYHGEHGVYAEGLHCMVTLARFIAELRRREQLLTPSAVAGDGGNMEETELKPCPFCGSAPTTHWDYTSDVHECYNEGFNIQCPTCDVRKYAIDKDDAIEAWNTRV